MLYELLPWNWNSYVNNPLVENGNLVFRSINDGGFAGNLRHGVGVYELPQYSPGDMLQWAMLARTPTPPATLDLVVPVAGSITNLTVYGISIESEWSWITTQPAVIDQYVSTLLAGIPDINKEIEIKTFLLGDPDSITNYINPPVQPSGKRIWPWVVGAIAVGLLFLKGKKK